MFKRKAPKLVQRLDYLVQDWSPTERPPRWGTVIPAKERVTDRPKASLYYFSIIEKVGLSSLGQISNKSIVRQINAAHVSISSAIGSGINVCANSAAISARSRFTLADGFPHPFLMAFI